MSEQQSSAAVAAQRVQAILEAAEATAREITDKARADAAAHVANAKDAIDGLMAQAEALQARMDEIATALGEAKAAVDAMAAEAKALVGSGSAEPPAAMAAAEPPVAAVTEPAEAPEPEAEPFELADPPAADAEPEPAAAPAESGSAAPEGARLVALNMALSGKPREETARYLRENFDFEGADALLDEVYAKVGS
jgi:cell division septum initiation protein DivIVA